jgi:hypothetical protein
MVTTRKSGKSKWFKGRRISSLGRAVTVVTRKFGAPQHKLLPKLPIFNQICRTRFITPPQTPPPTTTTTTTTTMTSHTQALLLRNCLKILLSQRGDGKCIQNAVGIAEWERSFGKPKCNLMNKTYNKFGPRRSSSG